jgi:hypothetical protein
LKQFNNGQGAWCIPRKGTEDYKKVRAIMDGGVDAKAAKKAVKIEAKHDKMAAVEIKKTSTPLSEKMPVAMKEAAKASRAASAPRVAEGVLKQTKATEAAKKAPAKRAAKPKKAPEPKKAASPKKAATPKSGEAPHYPKMTLPEYRKWAAMTVKLEKKYYEKLSLAKLQKLMKIVNDEHHRVAKLIGEHAEGNILAVHESGLNDKQMKALIIDQFDNDIGHHPASIKYIKHLMKVASPKKAPEPKKAATPKKEAAVPAAKKATAANVKKALLKVIDDPKNVYYRRKWPGEDERFIVVEFKLPEGFTDKELDKAWKALSKGKEGWEADIFHDNDEAEDYDPVKGYMRGIKREDGLGYVIVGGKGEKVKLNLLKLLPKFGIGAKI